MDLRDYFRLIRRRWRLITALTLVGLGAATAVTLTATPIYTANAQLFVSAQEGADSGVSAAYTGGLLGQQRVKSYVSILSSVRTAELVKTDLGLNRSASAIAGAISASAPLDTVLINVSVKDPDPAVAARIANSVGRTFPTLVDQIEAPGVGGRSPVKVTMVQEATAPGAPTSPRRTLNLALGLLVGLALGLGSAVLRETLDTSVSTTDALRNATGAPALGTIPFTGEVKKTPLIVATSPGSPMAEAFRQLRTNLQFVDIDHPVRSVVISSSVAAEGKSTTCCNLAIALSEAGLRVILVEGDLRRPRVAEYFGVEGALGLTTVLLGRATVDVALQPWGTTGLLEVLANGPLPPNPSELLGSKGMQDLLAELEERADIVLIDAPPLLPVTDAAVLGALTSGVVLVVRAGATRREQVEKSVETLRAAGGLLLGGILNMVSTKGSDGYGYGYGYGYARREDQPALDQAEQALLAARVSSRPTSGQVPPSPPESPRAGAEAATEDPDVRQVHTGSSESAQVGSTLTSPPGLSGA
jgi:succinoglycan biosynthesis transport protein ExoP